MTRKEKVLQYLEYARRIGTGSLVGPEGYGRIEDGWVDGHVLCRPQVGGSEGLRRLRELRADGIEIEQRNHPIRGRATRQYRLAPDTNRLFT